MAKNMYGSDIAANFGKSTAKEIAADKQSWQGGEGWSEAQFFGNPERGYEATGGLKEGWKLGLDGIPYNAALGGLLGGLGRGRGGGSGNNVDYAWQDYDRQMSLLDKIGEMSAGYSTYGTLGDTVVDYEGKKVTQTLSPELQAKYDALLAYSNLSADKVAAMEASPELQAQYDALLGDSAASRERAAAMRANPELQTQYDSLLGDSATSRNLVAAMRANPELQAQYDALLGGFTTSRARAEAMGANPELQAQSNALLARSGLSADRVAAMGANPYEMQQYLYDQNLALKQPEQEKLRTQTQEALAAKGMLGSTGGAGLYGEVEESIQRSNAQDFANAMAQSQQMLDMERARGSQDLTQSQQIREWSDRMMDAERARGTQDLSTSLQLKEYQQRILDAERARGTQDLSTGLQLKEYQQGLFDAERARGQQDFSTALQLKEYQQGLLDAERARGSQDFATATALGGLQVPFMESGRLYGQNTSIGNVEGISGASANIANQLATRDMGKAKQKQGLWDMLLGGGSGGGLFSLFG